MKNVLRSSLFSCLLNAPNVFAEVVSDNDMSRRLMWLGAGTVFYITTEAEKDSLDSPCRWCKDNYFDREIRSRLLLKKPENADRISNAAAFGLLPIASLSALWNVSDGWDFGLANDSLLVAESLVYSSDVNQLTKFAVSRERPFVHNMGYDQKGKGAKASDQNLSFYSGHTNLAFSLATSTSIILERHGKSPVYSYGLYGLAFAVALTRVEADKHWTTDVIVGALAGTFFSRYWIQKKDSKISVSFVFDRLQVDYFY